MNERLKERREKKRLQLEREQEVKEQEAAASRENTKVSSVSILYILYKKYCKENDLYSLYNI